MGAMSPDGRMYALLSEAYLLRSEDESQNAGLHHYVWDFAAGEAAAKGSHHRSALMRL